MPNKSYQSIGVIEEVHDVLRTDTPEDVIRKDEFA